MADANFCIERRQPGILTIRDVGPWDKCRTVTNDAEGVVLRLLKSGDLREGDRLRYFDSVGQLDEILIDYSARAFAGFVGVRYPGLEPIGD